MKKFLSCLCALMCLLSLSACQTVEEKEFETETEVTEETQEITEEVEDTEEAQEEARKNDPNYEITSAYLDKLHEICEETDKEFPRLLEKTRNVYGSDIEEGVFVGFRIEDLNQDGTPELFTEVLSYAPEETIHDQETKTVLGCGIYTYEDGVVTILEQPIDYNGREIIYFSYDYVHSAFQYYKCHGDQDIEGSNTTHVDNVLIYKDGDEIKKDYCQANIWHYGNPSYSDHTTTGYIYYNCENTYFSYDESITSESVSEMDDIEDYVTFNYRKIPWISMYWSLQDVFFDANKASYDTMAGLIKRGTSSMIEFDKRQAERYGFSGESDDSTVLDSYSTTVLSCLSVEEREDGLYLVGHEHRINYAYLQDLGRAIQNDSMSQQVAYKIADGATFYMEEPFQYLGDLKEYEQYLDEHEDRKFTGNFGAIVTDGEMVYALKPYF